MFVFTCEKCACIYIYIYIYIYICMCNYRDAECCRLMVATRECSMLDVRTI